jgi:hypothetical protein
MFTSVAQAGRKRIVVLDFEGPKAEKFHDDVVRIIKKTHTVVPTDKWTGVAEDLSAGTVNPKNIKKVAKKLKIDGVISGKIEKRRDAYLVHLTLRSGKTGEQVGDAVDTKSEGPRVDGKASDDISNELVGAIDALASNRASSSDDDEEEEKPAKKPKKDDDDEDEKPAKKDDDDDEEKPKHKGFSKHHALDDDDEKPAKKAKKDDDEDEKPAKHEEDENPLPKSKKHPKHEDDDDSAEEEHHAKKKKVAKSDDDDDAVHKSSDDDEPGPGPEARSPGNRALDIVIGLSVTARRLKFSSSSDLVDVPPGYKGNPVGGGMLDLTFYPAATSHKRKGISKNFGIHAMFDKVLSIKSKDPASMMNLATESHRYALGLVFRYPFGDGESAPVLGAALDYGKQTFHIDGMADIPNVKYVIIEPSVFFHYPITPKIIINVRAAFMGFTNAGGIQSDVEYGGATISGFEGEGGIDYMLKPSLFLRAALRYETIGFKFNGSGTEAINRDGDTTDQDVYGARDNYIGGFLTLGYAY